MTAVLVVVADYRDAFTAGVHLGWDEAHKRYALNASPLTDALSAHLAASVTAHIGPATQDPRALTLTVTGADPEDVDQAVALYLGSAQIRYQIGSAA